MALCRPRRNSYLAALSTGRGLALAAIAVVAAFPAAFALGCGGSAKFVWIDQYRDPRPAAAPKYVLGPGDVVQVRIFNQEGMSAKARVRSDGKITLPFLNDVQAAGYEPTVLTQQLQARLKDFVQEPVVTVSVEEERPMQVLMVGQVGTPGVVDLKPGVGVLQALLRAGGLTKFADEDSIFVVRRDPEAVRIRFKYKDLVNATASASNFRLMQGDAIVVE
jgi:polysaccharide export outer membrane protein